MIITPSNHIHMQRHPGRHCPAAQPMMHHLAIQLPNHRSLEIKVPHKERPRRYIDDRARERLIERRVAMTEAGEAGTGPQGGGEGGPESEERVFGRVVVVDCTYVDSIH